MDYGLLLVLLFSLFVFVVDHFVHVVSFCNGSHEPSVEPAFGGIEVNVVEMLVGTERVPRFQESLERCFEVLIGSTEISPRNVAMPCVCNNLGMRLGGAFVARFGSRHE
jgi:hypothetical protein